MIDEDADLRSNLAALGPGALRELWSVLNGPQGHRDELLRQMVGRDLTADSARQMMKISNSQLRKNGWDTGIRKGWWDSTRARPALYVPPSRR
jgi:hypothetical protein